MKSDKLIIIRDHREKKNVDDIAGMAIITASNGREDKDAAKYAIYNKKFKEIYGFALGCEGKTSISIEMFDATVVK